MCSHFFYNFFYSITEIYINNLMILGHLSIQQSRVKTHLLSLFLTKPGLHWHPITHFCNKKS